MPEAELWQVVIIGRLDSAARHALDDIGQRIRARRGASDATSTGGRFNSTRHVFHVRASSVDAAVGRVRAAIAEFPDAVIEPPAPMVVGGSGAPATRPGDPRAPLDPPAATEADLDLAGTSS